MAGRRRSNINISVAMLGETLRVYELPAKSNVQAALTAAGIQDGAGEVRVDAQSAKLTDMLKNGQVVTVVQKVQGG